MNDLRVFVMVAQLHSIRNAAILLHLSEDAVSRTIERVERECNYKLFTRHNRGGLKLTENGERLLQIALPLQTFYSSTLI